MAWIDEWRVTAASIDAAWEMLNGAGAYSNSSWTQTVVDQVRSGMLPPAVDRVEQLLASAESPLSVEAHGGLLRLVRECRGALSPTISGEMFTFQACAKLIVAKSIVNAAIADTQAIICRRMSRALVHLQAVLRTDGAVRNTWQEAWKRTEPALEELGAAHLLHHGIWCFKANAEGQRTDLIASPEGIGVDEFADGVVLTEWKVAHDVADGTRKIEDAIRQCDLYSAGVLGGIELRNDRYIIVVWETHAALSAHEVTRGGITYHIRHIVVNPSPASKEAKRRT